MDGYLTSEDLAERLGIKPTSVHRMRNRGDLPPPDKRIGRTPVWSAATIADWETSRPSSGWAGRRKEPPRLPMLIVTRGLPGSGKTTLARRLVESAPGRMARINRDDLRTQMHGGRLGKEWQEKQVTVAQRAAVAALLRSGVDVIADDTNLPDDAVEQWRQLAAECGAELQVIDLRHVEVDTCIARDAARGAAGDRMVGAEVIRQMAAAGRRIL